MRPALNILIGVSLPAWWEEMAIRRYRSFAAPDVEVFGASLSTAQQDRADASSPLEPLVEMGLLAEKKGAHAHILDCFGDPYLSELQQRVQRPVIGVGQSAMLAAGTWFERFSIITSELGTGKEIVAHAARYGVSNQLMDCRSIGIPASDIPSMMDEVLARTSHHARELAAAGSEAVLLGCTELAMLAPLLEQSLWGEGSAITIVNPIAVAQKWAEMTIVGCTHGLLKF